MLCIHCVRLYCTLDYVVYTVCMRYNISIPQPIMIELDSYAQAHNYNRSEAIREAIRQFIHSTHATEAKKEVVEDIVIPDFSKKAQARGLIG